MSARFPIRYATGNLLFGQAGAVSGLYRLGMSSYPFLPVAGKWQLQGQLERLAQTVAADFSLWRVSRAYPAEAYVKHTLGLLDERHQTREVWREFLAGHEQRLAKLGSHVPECYLAVSLAASQSKGFGSGLLRAGDWLRERAAPLTKTPPITKARLQELGAAEQRLFERLSEVLALRRAQTRELNWLLRRGATRGVGEPDLDGLWEPQALAIESDGEVAFQPLTQTLWGLGNCAITEHERTLQVDSEAGSSFQALLALGALADAPQFPGAAAEVLFAPVEAVAFPVDAVVHARWFGNREALGEVRKRIADVEHAYREQIEGSHFGPGFQAEENRTLAREYEARLQTGAHPAMLTGWVSLAVGARDQAELERRVGVLREHYPDIQLHRPAGLQHRLYLEHLPRPDGGVTGDYERQLTVEQFGAMVPTATRTVGSRRGAYLGFTPSGSLRPVRFDPTQAPRENRASGVLLVGTLGSGKTVCAQKIAFEAERRGSLIVDFDPKPDHGWESLPELDGRLHVIELTGEPSQQGKLDPLRIAEGELREELACSYLLDLLRDPPAAWENAISRAVKETATEPDANLTQVIDRLLQSSNSAAREAGEALEVIGDFGLARLAFGSGQDTLLEASASVTTIRMPGLTLPDPRVSRETYTRIERVSVATLSLVTAYSLRLVSHDRSRHKIVLLDEATFLLESPQGRAIVNRLVRQGRAFNATVLLGTQLASDLGDLAELIGTYLIFGQDSPSAAKRALQLIGLEAASDALVRQVQSLREGRCLMRDLDGRVGEVQVDLVYPELLAALATSPPSPTTEAGS
jgi:AAA-like domain